MNGRFLVILKKKSAVGDLKGFGRLNGEESVHLSDYFAFIDEWPYLSVYLRI
jgi:hypothetical protein